MGYGRKRAYGPRRYGRKKYRKAMFKRPSTRINRNNVYSLSKRVSSIARQVRSRAIIARFNYAQNVTLSGVYTAVTLSDPTAYEKVFGTTEAFETRKRFDSIKFNMDMVFECGSEPAQVDYTVFILSLKNSTANTVISECGEDLNTGTGLVTGKHYETLDGHAFVNPNMFQIHYVRRFSTVMSATVAGQTLLVKNLGDTHKRFYKKISWPRRISTGVQPSSFNSIPKSAIPDMGKLWIVAFNNNLNVDGEFPNLSINCMWTLKTV